MYEMARSVSRSRNIRHTCILLHPAGNVLYLCTSFQINNRTRASINIHSPKPHTTILWTRMCVPADLSPATDMVEEDEAGPEAWEKDEL